LTRSAACLLVLAGFALSACDGGPFFGLGLGFGPNGGYVSPTVSGRVGGVSVGAGL
jgi:hypothetical protein